MLSTGQRATFGLTPTLSRQRERGKYWILPALGGIHERRTRHEKLPEFSLHDKADGLYWWFLSEQNWRMSSLTSLAAAMADCWVGS